jgi:hypothetical protein
MEQNIPIVTSNDPLSLLAAFNKRCNFVQAGASDDISNKMFKEAMAVISQVRCDLPAWDENEIDRERWLSKFDATKRDSMVAAWHNIPEATIRDIRNKTITVKLEPLLKRDEMVSAGPRAVYVGSDLHNAITGPSMMVAMERLVYVTDTDAHGQCLGDGVHVRFGYKQSDVSLTEFLLRDSTLSNCLEGDYSRNDREQRSRVAILINEWLKQLKMPEWIRSLMIESSEEYDVYLPSAGLKATLKHQLPTGTTATTFRNSAYNAVMFVVSMKLQKAGRCRALILGDDLLALTQFKIDLHVWEQNVAQFKMVLKAAAPDIEGGATFLSRRLFTQCQVPCMMPKFGKALARFNVRATKNPGCSDHAYMAGKSLSYAYEFRHVPFIRKEFIARHKYHWRKMNSSERNDDVVLQEQSWFTRIAGLDTKDKVIKAIKTEKVLISDDYLRDWFVDTYSLGLCDVQELLVQFIRQTEYAVIDTPFYDNLAIDF